MDLKIWDKHLFWKLYFQISPKKKGNTNCTFVLHKEKWHWWSPFFVLTVSLTSTKASVSSLALSITGKWRPATILAFSLPGMIQFLNRSVNKHISTAHEYVSLISAVPSGKDVSQTGGLTRQDTQRLMRICCWQHGKALPQFTRPQANKVASLSSDLIA